jgi:hypothetical protein
MEPVVQRDAHRGSAGGGLAAADQVPVDEWESGPGDDLAPLHPEPRVRIRELPVGFRRWLLGLASYLPLAAFAYDPTWLHWSSQMNGGNDWDQVLEEWFLSWPSAAITHGHSLLTTTWLDVPGGVNLMWNTSMPILGILAFPLEKTIGPIGTYDVLATFGLAASAGSMWLLLRHWGVWWPAAWCGGLLFGFSPYVIAEGTAGRVHLLSNFLLPLIVLTVDKLVRGDEKGPTPRRLGVEIGLLCLAQFLIAEESLLLLVEFIALAFLLLLIFSAESRRVVRDQLGRIGRGAVWAICAFVPLASYPVVVQVSGSFKVHGPVQPTAQAALFSADLTSLFVPTQNQWIAPSFALDISRNFADKYLPEMTTYLGIPLFALIIAGVIMVRNNSLVRLFSALAVVAFVLSLGPRLIIANHHTSIPTPDALLAHVPGFQNIIPSRYALVMFFSIAVLFGIIVSALRAGRTQWPIEDPPPRSLGRTVSTLGVSAFVLLPLLPPLPFASVAAEVPSYFTSNAVDAIPTGSVALVYPIPRAQYDQAMLWQAESGMRFRQPGGYAVAPLPGGGATFYANVTDAEECVDGIYMDGTVNPTYCRSHVLLKSMRRLDIRTIVVPLDQAFATSAASLFESLLGRPPRTRGGVDVWAVDLTK